LWLSHTRTSTTVGLEHDFLQTEETIDSSTEGVREHTTQFWKRNESNNKTQMALNTVIQYLKSLFFSKIIKL
jgi:hypothetical protein